MGKNKNKQKKNSAKSGDTSTPPPQSSVQADEQSIVQTPAVKTRGVVLIALGHQQYGRMAFNLLMTIRSSDPDMPVTLIHNESSLAHLTQRQRGMFSGLISCHTELYHHDGKLAYVKPKVHAFDLSPYDKTLFLDCDMALMPGKKISALMDELDGKDFTIKNTGSYDIATKQHTGNPQYGYGGWEIARLEELASMYGIKTGNFTQLQGEVFYFEKTETARMIFDFAKAAWDQQKAFLVGGFAGQNMNDELAFIIALGRAGVVAHSNPWVPSYWYLLEGGVNKLNRTTAISNFWLLSAGGHNVPQPIMSFYNDVVAKAHNQIGLRPLFPLKRKIDYLTERKLF